MKLESKAYVSLMKKQIERKKIKNILTERGIKNVNILIGSVSSGFIFPEGKIAVITEKEIFGERKQIRPTKSRDIPSVFITSFREFEFTFTYEETQDQEAAIDDVMSDMESLKAMDRLICGDVGFGKTEVAVRAAFKAAMDGKQVAILVPTTLLAYQHYITFTERLKGYPVVTEMLSRFKTQKEIREIQKKLENGTIDIIIGTHKLLGDKVKFKDLGLVVIDEEHRFGVAHKEKLRKLKKGVEVLALSATPIPRTLQLSLAGIRDISLINTPPEGRQSIETYVSQFNGDIIRDAIRRELNRSGSVFFIHNRIEDILRIAETIRELAPEAKIDITHGRMEGERLEKAILRFIQGKTDVLVTTAIVEAGLDIPRANTIIVNYAHTFGLADLYQLRGRVGRAEKKAYAYFLIPSVNILTPEANNNLIDKGNVH